jgi:15-cis-phytoene synthase
LSGQSDLQSNFDYCAELTREADHDRYLATLFAPAEHRNALFALYAFNVEIARIRDLAHEPMPGEIRLQWWREIILGERHGEAAGHPVAAAIQSTCKRHALSSEDLTAIIDAHSFDLYSQPIATLNELETYTARTQGKIFELASVILGTEGVSKTLIRHAGVAYGMMRIMNDFAHHALRQQIFVPLDLLKRQTVSTGSIIAGRSTSELKAALAELRNHARHHLSAAKMEFESAPPAIWPVILPVALVGPQFRLMDRRGYEPFEAVPLSAIRRSWLLWRAAHNPKRIFSC